MVTQINAKEQLVMSTSLRCRTGKPVWVSIRASLVAGFFDAATSIK